MKRLLLGAMATCILVGAAFTAFAAPSTEEPTPVVSRRSESATAELPAQNNEVARLTITMGDPFADTSGLAVSQEEATRIGMDAIKEFYGVTADELSNFTAQVFYQPQMDPQEFLDSPTGEWDEVLDMFVEDGTVRDSMLDEHFPLDVHRGMWLGSVSVSSLPSDNGWQVTDADGVMTHSHDTFRFTVDAETGALLGLQYFPCQDPRSKTTQNDTFASAAAVFDYAHNMTAQHNTEYANHAMQFARESNLFENEVRRAIIIGGGWMRGRDSSFEMRVAVAVECVDGETVVLQFQGRARKELVDVDFATRKIDYAVNRDGSVTEPISPISRFVDSPDSLFDFGWVYR